MFLLYFTIANAIYVIGKQWKETETEWWDLDLCDVLADDQVGDNSVSEHKNLPHAVNCQSESGALSKKAS